MVDTTSVETSEFELSVKTRNTAEIKSDDFLRMDNENSKTESSSQIGFDPQSAEDFERIEVIGQGSYGKVVLVRSKIDGPAESRKLYALKVINKMKLAKIDPELKSVKNEKVIMEKLSNLDCPYIVKMYNSFETDKNAYMLLEYCPGGELYRLIQRSKRGLGPRLLKYYAACLIVGLEVLHNNNVIYKDLKTENVVINENGMAILTDFGVSIHSFGQEDSFLDAEFKKKQITPHISAPEVIESQSFSQASDWFAFGCLLYEMAVGR